MSASTVDVGRGRACACAARATPDTQGRDLMQTPLTRALTRSLTFCGRARIFFADDSRT